MRRWTTIGAGIGFVLCGTIALAQQAKPGADRPKDREAIAALASAFGKAYTAADAKAVAALFAEDAQLIDEDGEVVAGRAGIEARFAEGFQGAAGRKIELAIPALRFLGDSAALADGVATVTQGEYEPVTVQSKIALQAREGKWSIAQIHDLPAPREIEPESNYERLQELEWLLGDWVEESKDVLVRTSWAWSENKNFIVGHYEMKREGQEPLSGSQRIGWDPLTRQIRSWTFDSNGGYGQGLWSRRGDNQWIVKAEGVLRDAQTATTTQTLTRMPNDRASWSFTDRVAGGEALPDVEPLVVVRQPPKPK